MAKIFYGMCGEGRGHAARVQSMVEHLQQDHDLVLFAPEQAFEFLSPRYAQSSRVQVRRIPGLRFQYTRKRLNLARSIAAGLGYLARLPQMVRSLCQQIERESPDLVITDFEPALPRAAKQCGIPYVSLDHQHFLTTSDLSCLPWKLRPWATAMSVAVRMHYSSQAATLVSSFFKSKLHNDQRNVHHLGPLLRPLVEQTAPSAGDYLLSYLRPHAPLTVLEMLQDLRRPVRVYGLGKQPADGYLTFHALDEHAFVEDLAGCAAIVGAAGNQTIGEALYSGKPVLALPERNHHEQRINGHFVAEMKVGESVVMDDLRTRHLLQFVDRLEYYQQRVRNGYQGRNNSTPDAVRLINQRIAGSRLPVSCGVPEARMAH